MDGDMDRNVDAEVEHELAVASGVARPAGSPDRSLAATSGQHPEHAVASGVARPGPEQRPAGEPDHPTTSDTASGSP